MPTGKPPWCEATTHIAAMCAIVTSDSMPTLPPTLSRECTDFLSNCMNRDPALRPSASNLLQHPFLAAAGDPIVPTSARREEKGDAALAAVSRDARTVGLAPVITSRSGGSPDRRDSSASSSMASVGVGPGVESMQARLAVVAAAKAAASPIASVGTGSVFSDADSAGYFSTRSDVDSAASYASAGASSPPPVMASAPVPAPRDDGWFLIPGAKRFDLPSSSSDTPGAADHSASSQSTLQRQASTPVVTRPRAGTAPAATASLQGGLGSPGSSVLSPGVASVDSHRRRKERRWKRLGRHLSSHNFAESSDSDADEAMRAAFASASLSHASPGTHGAAHPTKFFVAAAHGGEAVKRGSSHKRLLVTANKSQGGTASADAARSRPRVKSAGPRRSGTAPTTTAAPAAAGAASPRRGSGPAGAKAVMKGWGSDRSLDDAVQAVQTMSVDQASRRPSSASRRSQDATTASDAHEAPRWVGLLLCDLYTLWVWVCRHALLYSRRVHVWWLDGPPQRRQRIDYTPIACQETWQGAATAAA